MTETIQLVEQHIIKKTDPRFETIDRAAFASKNLYNAANYIVRQEFINHNKYLNYAAIYHLVKDSEAYQALPRKVSNLVLKQLDQNWRAFFAAMREWQEHPEKFLGRPGLPKYKDKQNGRNLLVYDTQAISKVGLRDGLVKPSQLDIVIETKQKNVDQVRIVPRNDHYIAEVVYSLEVEPSAQLDTTLVAGIDLGVDNLATVASNKAGFQPFVVNGRPLKSVNQFYNKHKANLQSQLPGKKRSSKRIQLVSNKRNQRVKDYLHKASKFVIDELLTQKIGTLVIGYNKGWKQQVEIGRRNNQTFVSIPHGQFLKMLKYKAQLAGLKVIEQEESYTSKCSFLDLEPIQKKKTYLGKRISRGLFRASDGRLINADLNGAYNIIRKAIPNAFADGIEAVAVRPVRVDIPIGPSAKEIGSC
jgi:putative transposase